MNKFVSVLIIISILVTASLVTVTIIARGGFANEDDDKNATSTIISKIEYETLSIDSFDGEDETNVSKSENNIPNVAVVDAVDYIREIVSVYGIDYSGYYHTIKIPKINLATENATKLNEKIYSDFSEPYNRLLNNAEEHMLYNIEYKYAVCDNVVGIIVNFSGCPQGGDGWDKYGFYYYDLQNDVELSFEEYANFFGYSVEDLENEIMNMEAAGGYGRHTCLLENSTLAGCIADRTETSVVFYNTSSMNGDAYYTVDPIV